MAAKLSEPQDIKINTLLVENFGVIEAVNPVVTNELEDVDVADVKYALTTCNTLPAGRTDAAIVPVN